MQIVAEHNDDMDEEVYSEDSFDEADLEEAPVRKVCRSETE